MKLAYWQRISALLFLVAFVVQSHWAHAKSPAGAHIGLLAVVILAGVVHIATSLFVVATDYEARPRFVRFLGTALAVAAGAAVVSTGRTVVSTDAEPPTPGHLAGSACDSCHAGTEGRHGRVSVAQHRDSSIGCEDCHDVMRGRRPWLARSWPRALSPCSQCHESAWGGFVSASPAPAASVEVSGPTVASASAPAQAVPPAPLCAVDIGDESDVDEALAKREAISFELRSSDRQRFAEGQTRLTLRAAAQGTRLHLDASWTDSTENAGDRFDLLTFADGSVPGLEKLGCVDTCHLGDPKPHRADAGEALTLYVVDRTQAREHRVTERGVLPVTGHSGLGGGLKRTAEGCAHD